MWYARLGHVSFSSIKNMMDLRLIPKSELVSKFCEVCIQSKFARKPFKSVEICSELLGLIHSDICELNGN